MLLSIDPGPEQSAWVLYDGARPVQFGKNNNAYLRLSIQRGGMLHSKGDHLVIEMIASYGMPVGAEVFMTCVAVGRFVQAWDRPYTLMPRREVKLHLCGSARANDATIRAALLDKWGGRKAALGDKRSPGPLRGVSGDVWAALGVAVTWTETKRGEP